MTHHINDVTLDEATIRYRNPEIKHEREMAITDLLHENHFKPIEIPDDGPYQLHLSAVDQRLFMGIKPTKGKLAAHTVILSMRGFRKLIKDYFMMWESYSEAVATHTPEKLQAIDMGRRAIHDEAAELLMQTVKEEIEMDMNTARRIFTLICILHLN